MREREADTNEVRMRIEDAQNSAVIFGSGDHNAKKIHEAFGSDIVQRGDEKQILNYTEESQTGPVTLPDDILDELGPISVALVGLGTDGSKITTFYAPQLFRVVTAGATSEV